MSAIKSFILVSLLILSGPAGADMVVVVSQDNDVAALSQRQVVDIYMGRYQSFPNGKTALPIDHASNSVLRETFYRMLVNRTLAEINAYWARLLFTGRASPPRIINDPGLVLEAIAENPSAIGYMDSDMVTDRVKVVTHVR